MPSSINDGWNQKRVYSPRPGAAANAILVLAAFVFMFGTSAVFFYSQLEQGGTAYFALLGMVVAMAFFPMSLRRLTTSRSSYALDPSGITRVGSNQHVSWSQVADLELAHSFHTGGELSIVLKGYGGRKMMVIMTEMLERGGRDLVMELHKYLQPLFERTARQYLSGERKWSLGLLKTVFRIEGDILFAEYPAGKKQAIPLAGIQLADWVPGAISGGRHGYVFIRHAQGTLEVPQLVSGVQYLLFALKFLYGLGDRICPPPKHELEQQLVTERKWHTRAAIARMAGLAFMAGSFIVGIRTGTTFLEENAVKQMGEEVEATVVAKVPPSSLKISFNDPSDRAREVTVRVEEDLYIKMSPNSKFPVLAHARYPGKVWFSGKWELSAQAKLLFMAGFLVAFVIGIILWIWGRRTAKAKEGRFRELQPSPVVSTPVIQPQTRTTATQPLPDIFATSAPPPLPAERAVSGQPVPDISAAQPLPDIFATSAPPPLPSERAVSGQPSARICSNCKLPIVTDYYLCDGGPWCPQCTHKASGSSARVGCSTLFRAGLTGLVGAVLGGGLWTASTVITNHELGFIAIVVGVVVGLAVKKGAGQQSGRSLQLLAMALTFVALAYSYIPIMYFLIRNDPKLHKEFTEAFQGRFGGEDNEAFSSKRRTKRSMSADEQRESKELAELEAMERDENPTSFTQTRTDLAQLSAANGASRPRAASSQAAPPGSLAALSATSVTRAAQAPADEDDLSRQIQALQRKSGRGRSSESDAMDNPFAGMSGTKIIGLVILVLVILIIAVPLLPPIIYILMLFQSPMSGIFLAIALWECWRLNRPQPRSFLGPYNDRAGVDFQKADFTRQ